MSYFLINIFAEKKNMSPEIKSNSKNSNDMQKKNRQKNTVF